MFQLSEGDCFKTLIEALCCITTGALPAGGKQSFLHSVDVSQSTSRLFPLSGYVLS